MTERIPPRWFHAAAGVEDWRVPYSGACAHVRSRSFAAGVALVGATARLAEDASRHPGIDPGYRGATVRPRTHEVDAPSEPDLARVRKISAAAREPGMPADPAAVQDVGVTIDALVGPAAMPFWRACLATVRRATKTSSIPAAAVGRPGSGRWTRPARGATASASTSPCPTTCPATWPRRASRRRSRPAATSSPTASRPPGGCSPMPRATRPAWPPGWTVAEPAPTVRRTRGAPGTAAHPTEEANLA